MTGIDPFDFFKFADEQQPTWLPKLKTFYSIWMEYQTSLRRTSEILSPLHQEKTYHTTWLLYPRGQHAWEAAEDLIASSNLSFDQIANVVDPFSASDELFSHIFFEKYLELYEGSRSPDELFASGARAFSESNSRPTKSVDWRCLYEYCDARFRDGDLRTILMTSYMFRLPFLRAMPAVLLSNPRLVDFLSSLPVEERHPDQHVRAIDGDVISWEFFRQLLSPRTDPLSTNAVTQIQTLLRDRQDEIDALKRRCLVLAQALSQERDLNELQQKISQHIRVNVEKDVLTLLSLDRAAGKDFLDSVFSDEKTWAGIATFLFSLSQGGAWLTAGAAICALSSVGSKAMKTAAERRKKLEASDYALLYRVQRQP